MLEIGKPTCLYLDETTKKKIDKYGEKRQLSRSAALRLIVNEFFLKKRGNR